MCVFGYQLAKTDFQRMWLRPVSLCLRVSDCPIIWTVNPMNTFPFFFFLERPMKEMLNKSFKLVTEASGTEASLAAMSSPQHSFGLFFFPHLSYSPENVLQLNWQTLHLKAKWKLEQSVYNKKKLYMPVLVKDY